VLGRARHGDARARRVEREAQHALAELVVRAAGPRRRSAPIAVSWAGGLLDDPRFRAGVWRALRRRGARIRPVTPRAAAATPEAWLSLR